MMRLSLLPLLTLTTLTTLLACGGDAKDADPTGQDPAVDQDSGEATDGGDAVAGRCTYVNPFSQGAECKEYTGSGWDLSAAQADCAAPMPGAGAGSFEAELACDREGILGECFVGDDDLATVLVFPGDDQGSCSGVELGCGFAGGDFVHAEVCAGGGGGGGGSLSVFQPFEQVCVDPLDGEPAGQSADGQVCTWEAIYGATEEGRRYIDYASCEPVLTQRPYWPASATADTAPDDPRLSDATWQAEFSWMTAQVESSACVCCHSTDLAPDGPSGWYLEAGPIWIDTLDDDGLAMLAGWVDSTAFGAFDAEDNNGFDRSTTGLPTTDVPRMQAFLEGELRRRGLDLDDFSETPPFGGPLYDQLFYTPEACVTGQGITADGRIQWTGGDARYIYLLQPDSMNPGVPPNLDLPEGTIWRFDVAWDADPVASGLRYGELPPGTRQAFPEDAEAPVLQPGDQLYLYVLRDIYQPITRCTFTMP